MRVGILGCGHIARKLAADLQFVQGAILQAVGARSKSSADAFNQIYPAQNVHYSYEALVKDSSIDVIYIATPHAFHAEHALLCLKHGKHVLCEKSFTLNAKQAEAIFETASINNLFVMEALWTKFLPHYIETKNLIETNTIGTIQHINASFGFVVDKPIGQRLWNPTLGGGSLLDIGVYNVFMVQSLMGMPNTISAHASMSKTGVDASCAAQFEYENGSSAQLYCSFTNYAPIEIHLLGSKGRIHLKSRYYAPSSDIVLYPGTDETATNIPVHQEPGWGYQYQLRHVKECIGNGLIESPIMSWQDTINQMKTLDTIRKKAGIVYEVDGI